MGVASGTRRLRARRFSASALSRLERDRLARTPGWVASKTIGSVRRWSCGGWLPPTIVEPQTSRELAWPSKSASVSWPSPSQSTADPAQVSSRRCCEAIPRLAIGSAGTTATRAFTRPRAAHFEPNNGPRSRSERQHENADQPERAVHPARQENSRARQSNGGAVPGRPRLQMLRRRGRGGSRRSVGGRDFWAFRSTLVRRSRLASRGLCVPAEGHSVERRAGHLVAVVRGESLDPRPRGWACRSDRDAKAPRATPRSESDALTRVADWLGDSGAVMAGGSRARRRAGDPPIHGDGEKSEQTFRRPGTQSP
jgi:hypothetical protein